MGERTFSRERDRLRSALRELVQLTAGSGAAAAAASLDAKLSEGTFNVVVLGEFKRGKTTLVNALLGAEVLPMGVTPLTSIVTTVSWGPEVRARIRFLDGGEEEAPVEQLGRYVTERDNPENRLGVDEATLSYPAEDLEDGVILVDTPGVGSVFRHNTEAARAFLPNADAAIFLLAADPPISETERAYLAEVREEAGKVFFVLNKVDYLDEAGRAEAIGFTERVLAESIGHEVPLHVVSARTALRAKLDEDRVSLENSGFATFERDFRAFLLREKGDAMLRSVASRAGRLVDGERNTLAVEERTLSLSAEEVDRTKAEMEKVFTQAAAAREDLRALLRADLDKVVETVEGDLEELRVAEEAALRSVAERFLRERAEVRRASGELDALLKQALEADIERWRHDEDAVVGRAFADATARLAERADELASDTARLCGEILGLELAVSAMPAELSGSSGFSYSFFEPPTIMESLLPEMRRFLPEKAARKVIERELAERIPELVDKHCGRLRWDLVQRLERTRRDVEAVLDDRLEATIGSLRSGIDRPERARVDHERELDQRLEEIGRERAALDELGRVFGDVAGAARAAEARVAV